MNFVTSIIKPSILYVAWIWKVPAIKKLGRHKRFQRMKKISVKNIESWKVRGWDLTKNGNISMGSSLTIRKSKLQRISILKSDLENLFAKYYPQISVIMNLVVTIVLHFIKLTKKLKMTIVNGTYYCLAK